MIPVEARHLVVGRLRKPHGLKGACALFPLTDEPAEVFAAGREDRVRLVGQGKDGAVPLESMRFAEAPHDQVALRPRSLQHYAWLLATPADLRSAATVALAVAPRASQSCAFAASTTTFFAPSCLGS